MSNERVPAGNLPVPCALTTACTVALATMCASAATSPFDATVALEHASYDAREALPGSSFVLNRESGALNGGMLEASAPVGSGAWAASLRALSGGLSYRGFSQFGLPIETRSDLSIRRAELVLDPFGAFTIGHGEARFAVAAARQSIDRRIRASPTSGALGEVLTSDEIGLRAHMSVPLVRGDRPVFFLMRLEAWRPWRQRLIVDSGGVFDVFRLEPAPRSGMRFDARVTMPAGDAITVGAAVGASWLRFGKSEAVPVFSSGRPTGVAFYPGSRQRLRTVAVHAEWSFDKPPRRARDANARFVSRE